jgi:hypothetical protein
MKFLVLIGVFLGVVTAEAEIVFSPSVSYFKTKDESNGATAGESEVKAYDFKLGYLDGSGLFLGGMYSMISYDDNDGKAFGPTLGYSHYSGFYALFTYFLVAEQDISATQTLVEGMGPQIDVGWVFPITRMFMIGPQISYRSISYDKIDNSGTESTLDYSRSQIMPYISLWFRF